ncbi:MAG: 3-phosphoglycerate dehydrogenase family protein [Candidatus Izemoplasmatales bacterium]|jgi:D-3-phosphoglycerate dehydrogenase|nr:3-phosphoglycerate dehydrogenase family protein [Candidatus Izemoplasmatales bacterium]
MKIACLNNISPIGLATLPTHYQVVPNVVDADAILVRSQNMLDMTLPPSILAIARAGAGVNNIPLEKCADLGIVVFNTPGANANGVKELVIAGMLLASRDIYHGIQWVEANKTDPDIQKTIEKAKAQFVGTEILGKKLGVIGLGAIGVLVANAAVGLGMTVYGADPFISETNKQKLLPAVNLVTNDQIYAECDFVTIHVPALPETKGMFNVDVFAKMKDGSVLLNFARDILVNDNDLKAALEIGKIRRYVTDFPNAKTANMDGVITIPHLGASTEESEDNCAIMAVKQIVDYIDNGNIVNSVNFPSVDAGISTSQGRLVILYKNVEDMVKIVNEAIAVYVSDNSPKIEALVNKTKGAYGAMIVDLNVPARFSIQQKLATIEGVIAVRLVK